MIKKDFVYIVIARVFFLGIGKSAFGKYSLKCSLRYSENNALQYRYLINVRNFEIVNSRRSFVILYVHNSIINKNIIFIQICFKHPTCCSQEDKSGSSTESVGKNVSDSSTIDVKQGCLVKY